MYFRFSHPGGSPHPLLQVWAWPQWWLCSSVTRTTSWFWCGGSIFSSTPSPTRYPGPYVGTPGTPRTARRISAVPATTAALPCPRRQSPPLACSPPPPPWWTCLQLSPSSTVAALRRRGCGLRLSSSGSMFLLLVYLNSNSWCFLQIMWFFFSFWKQFSHLNDPSLFISSQTQSFTPVWWTARAGKHQLWDGAVSYSHMDHCLLLHVERS